MYYEHLIQQIRSLLFWLSSLVKTKQQNLEPIHRRELDRS